MFKKIIVYAALCLICFCGWMTAASASESVWTSETAYVQSETFTSAESFMLAYNPLPVPGILLAQASASAAVETPQVTETPGLWRRWMQRQEELGPWWNRSPFEYDPIPQDWLWRVSLQYNYVHETGNFSRDNHDLTFQLITRKARLTNYFKYHYDRRDVTKPADDIVFTPEGTYPPESTGFYFKEIESRVRDSTRHNLTNELRFALSPRIYLAPGLMWEKDNYVSVENRFTYYAGVGYRVLQRENAFLQVFGAYAYETLEHTDEYNELGNMLAETGLMTFDDSRDDYSGYYFSQDFHWQITSMLAFQQNFSYLGKFDKGSHYRWDLGLGLEVQLARYISLGLGYNETFDNSPMLFIRSRDTSTTAGLKISF